LFENLPDVSGLVVPEGAALAVYLVVKSNVLKMVGDK
jgi:hypothetical protein